jgi:hypothetical protein
LAISAVVLSTFGLTTIRGDVYCKGLCDEFTAEPRIIQSCGQSEQSEIDGQWYCVKSAGPPPVEATQEDCQVEVDESGGTCDPYNDEPTGVKCFEQVEWRHIPEYTASPCTPIPTENGFGGGPCECTYELTGGHPKQVHICRETDEGC